MATLAEALKRAKVEHILQQPTDLATEDSTLSTATNTTLNIAVVNNTGSSNAYVYVNGLAGGNNDAVFMLESDGKTVYYPPSPSSTLTPLGADCAIKLGAPGSTTTITVPYTDGGRLWFSRDATLTFLVNPGPALVLPSPTNTTDPNYNIYWDFCEFTFNTSQLYVNITLVDFVSLPIGLKLENSSGAVTTVEGLPDAGLDTVCSGLTAQTAADGQPWSSLIVQYEGVNLRALSPNSGIAMNSSLFSGYYQPYVDEVWAKYSNGANLTIDTQTSQYGSVNGTVTNNALTFSGVGSYSQPSTADIFSNSSGPFAQTGAELQAITPRLAAAFVRSTLLIDAVQPDNEVVSTYYQNTITDHYARICHATLLDGKGYSFPYDDVAPTGGADQSGYLSDPNPELLTVTLGGPTTAATLVNLRDMATRVPQRPGGSRQSSHQSIRRSGMLSEAHHVDDRHEDNPDADSAVGFSNDSADTDLEKGLSRGKQALFSSIDDNEKSFYFGGAGKENRGFTQNDDEKGLFNMGIKEKGKQTGSGENVSSLSSLQTRSLGSLVPAAWGERVASLLERLDQSASSSTLPSSSFSTSSPSSSLSPGSVYAKTARPVVHLVARLLTLFLSMSVRALVSRVTMALFLVLVYFVLPFAQLTAGGSVGGYGSGVGEVGAVGDGVLRKPWEVEGLGMEINKDEVVGADMNGGGWEQEDGEY